MSASIDSLSIKVDTSARSANQQLDKLVQKMIELRATVNGISFGNFNAVTAGIQKFSKAVTQLNQVKTSDFTRMAKSIEKLTNMNSSNLDQSAQSVEKAAGSLQRVSSISKNAMSSGLKFDSSGAQDMQKAIQSLSAEYANAGKGKAFVGTLEELEKQADKLRRKLDDLAEKEERTFAVGGTSAENKTFRGLQFDISKTMNQLIALEDQMNKMRSADKQDISSIPIFRHDDVSAADLTENSGLVEFQEKADQVFRKIPESAKYSAEAAQQSLQEALKEVHVGEGEGATENSGLRNYANEIKELESTLKSLEQSGEGMGSDKWDEAYIALHKVNMEVKEYKENLLRPWKEGDEEVRKTDSLGNKVEELNAKLKELKARGLNFGDGEFDDVYRALQRTTGELKEYKAVLNKPSTEIDEEVRKTDSLGNQVEELKAKLKDLQAKGLNFGDGEFDKTFQALQKSSMELKKYKANLSDTGKTAQSVSKGICDAFRSVWNQTKKTGSAIVAFGSKVRGLTTRFHSMSSSTNGLIRKLMKLYIGFHSLKSAGRFLTDSVQSSMDYIEEYNYFSTTMDKIAGEWSKDYKKYGYDNADTYGQSFKDRLTGTLTKMTGFQMEDDGTLTDTGTKNLGLDVTEMTNYAASVAQVTNSVGLAGEASSVTSQALSMLAGDMSSFRNQDMSTVMNNFSSGLIGQSRALYQYGIDITNATLATYAHDLGIKKNISDMTQAEKMQLRMIAILDQSKVAWGDLAKTINSPSNQLRLLQNNFKTLSRTIGNIFLPVVTKVLPYINGLVIAIRRLFEWTASMLGIDLSDIVQDSGVGGSGAFDGLEEDANDASDAVDDTTDSVKKLAKQLMGFDELNVITTNNSNSKDKDKDSTPIDLTSQLSGALADYEAVWNKAYKDMTSDAEKFANKLTKLFKDAWTSGDGSDIGSAIAEWLNKGISWVNKNVDKFAAGLKKIANMLATGVNGYVEKLDWAGLGTAIGKSLKAFFDAETHFFDTVNWVNLGKALSTSLNSAVDSGVLQSYFTLIASKLKAGIETAFGAVTTFKFGNLGAALGQGINDFFKKMGEVNKQTGLNGWQELGVTLSTGISGILDSFTIALKTVKWKEVGQSIADFIKNMEVGDITWSFGRLVNAAATALYTIVSNKETWSELGNKISDGINKFFKSMNAKDLKTGMTGWEALGKSISGTLTGLADTLSYAIEHLEWDEITVGIKDLVTNLELDEVVWKFLGLKTTIESALAKAITKLTGLEVSTNLLDLIVNITLLKIAFGKISQSKIVSTAISAGKNLLISAGLLTEAGKFSISLTGIKDAILRIGNGVSLAMPSPAVDEIVRTLETWFTDKVWKPICRAVPWLDENSELGVFQIIANPVISIGKGIFKFFGDTWNNTTGLTEGIDVGNNIANGILRGIANALIFPAMFLYNLIIKPIKEALGIHSPSTVAEKDIGENLADGIVEGLLGLAGKIKEKINVAWENVKSWWNTYVKLPDIKLPTIADIKKGVSDAWTKAKNWWNSNVKLPKIKLPTIADIKKGISDAWTKAKNWWSKNVKLPKINLPTIADIKEGISDAWTKAKNWWNDHVKLPDIKFQAIATTTVKNWLKPIVTVLNSIIDGFNKLMKLNWGDFKIAGKTIVKKGSFTLLTIPTIKGFASGGFPEQGQYFLARENGPELVGTIGGKSAVVNNPQIVQSVSDGVFNALAPVLTQVVNAVNGLQANPHGGQPLYVEGVSDGDIVRITTRANSYHKKRFGKPLYT